MDITMCKGENCPHKESCHRFTANPSDYQSYFLKAPIKDDKCDMYWGENQENIWNQLNDICQGSPDTTTSPNTQNK